MAYMLSLCPMQSQKARALRDIKIGVTDQRDMKIGERGQRDMKIGERERERERERELSLIHI